MKVLYHTLEVELYIDMMTIGFILIQRLYNIYNKEPNQSHFSLLQFHTTSIYLLDYSYSLPSV